MAHQTNRIDLSEGTDNVAPARVVNNLPVVVQNQMFAAPQWEAWAARQAEATHTAAAAARVEAAAARARAAEARARAAEARARAAAMQAAAVATPGHRTVVMVVGNGGPARIIINGVVQSGVPVVRNQAPVAALAAPAGSPTSAANNGAVVIHNNLPLPVQAQVMAAPAPVAPQAPPLRLAQPSVAGTLGGRNRGKKRASRRVRIGMPKKRRNTTDKTKIWIQIVEEEDKKCFKTFLRFIGDEEGEDTILEEEDQWVKMPKPVGLNFITYWEIKDTVIMNVQEAAQALEETIAQVVAAAEQLTQAEAHLEAMEHARAAAEERVQQLNFEYLAATTRRADARRALSAAQEVQAAGAHNVVPLPAQAQVMAPAVPIAPPQPAVAGARGRQRVARRRRIGMPPKRRNNVDPTHTCIRLDNEEDRALFERFLRHIREEEGVHINPEVEGDWVKIPKHRKPQFMDYRAIRL